MNIEPDIFDYLETTSLEPHDDYTSEFTYAEQKQIWNRIKEQKQQIQELTNNWNELEDILKIKKERILNEPDYSKYYLGGYETAIQTTHSSHSGIMLETAKKSIVVLCDELLDKMKKIKEKNNER